MRFHREGKTIMFISLLIALILQAIAYFIGINWLSFVIGFFNLFFLVLIFQFFRYPTRIYAGGPLDIISPADGKVVVIEKVFEIEYLNK